MAARQVLVEIALSSNDLILGVRGSAASAAPRTSGTASRWRWSPTTWACRGRASRCELREGRRRAGARLPRRSSRWRGTRSSTPSPTPPPGAVEAASSTRRSAPSSGASRRAPSRACRGDRQPLPSGRRGLRRRPRRGRRPGARGRASSARSSSSRPATRRKPRRPRASRRSGPTCAFVDRRASAPGARSSPTIPERAADVVRAQVAATPAARAVGEIGLDYHYDFSPRDVQQAVFRGAGPPGARARAAGRHPHARGRRRHDRDPAGARAAARCAACCTASRATPALARGRPRPRASTSRWPGSSRFPKAADAARHRARRARSIGCSSRPTARFWRRCRTAGKRNEPAYVARVAEALAALHGAVESSRGRRRELRALFRP